MRRDFVIAVLLVALGVTWFAWGIAPRLSTEHVERDPVAEGDSLSFAFIANVQAARDMERLVAQCPQPAGTYCLRLRTAWFDARRAQLAEVGAALEVIEALRASTGSPSDGPGASESGAQP